MSFFLNLFFFLITVNPLLSFLNLLIQIFFKAYCPNDNNDISKRRVSLGYIIILQEDRLISHFVYRIQIYYQTVSIVLKVLWGPWDSLRSYQRGLCGENYFHNDIKTFSVLTFTLLCKSCHMQHQYSSGSDTQIYWQWFQKKPVWLENKLDEPEVKF